MVGEQSYKQEIDKVITEISKTEPDFDKRIIFLDFTENVAELMNAFDVFIMSSRSETFGLVNIEALASGLPVLATNSGGIPEIIKDNYNGLLFSREDFMEASRKLKLLYKSPELMKKLSENALEDVKNKYDYKTQTDKFFEFCNVVYNNRIKKST
jgi:glycosyltransferase involved in cell wall biosynthesis